MANDVNNVTTGKPKVGGAIYVAPLGTTAPTDATTALANTFKSLGYISEEGFTIGNEKNTGTVKAWGGDVVDAFNEGDVDIAKFKLIEALNMDVIKTVRGASNVTGTAMGTGTVTVHKTADEFTHYMWVVDEVLKGGMMKRTVIYDAPITSIGDILNVDNDLIGYDLEVTCIPHVVDSSTGKTASFTELYTKKS